jgi:3-oxoacyl-[acyl-carrier protein] reductase
VNNAGLSSFTGGENWDVLDATVFQRIFGVNVLGAFQMVRACLPHLKAARGAIVNVSSIAGALGIGSSVPYIASKGAVNSMTLHLARSLAPEIRVNAVCPGLITTRWFGVTGRLRRCHVAVGRVVREHRLRGERRHGTDVRCDRVVLVQ